MKTKRYVYYTPFRPPTPGAIPINGLVECNDYGERTYIPFINREAWGSATYVRKLSDGEIDSFELMEGPVYEL